MALMVAAGSGSSKETTTSKLIPYWAEYAFGVVLIFLSYWIAKGWRRLQSRLRMKREQKAAAAALES